MSTFFGTPSEIKQVSPLTGQQERLQSQLTEAAMGRGGGTPFGQASSYYQDLLGGDQTYQAMAAPEMRQFREEIMPSLAEQFAGMGAGGSFGSAFQGASAQAGAGLAERLAAMRAGLRQQGAQGLMGLGQRALTPYQQLVQTQRQPGLLEHLTKIIGPLIGTFGGTLAGGLGQAALGKILGGIGGQTQQ